MKAPTLYRDDGTEEALPFRWEICGSCNGHGHNSAHLGVVHPEEWEPEEFEIYIGGEYDQTCSACEGSGKVMVPDYKRMKPEDRAAYRAQERDMREIDAIQRQEMLREGGWHEEGWFRQ